MSLLCLVTHKVPVPWTHSVWLLKGSVQVRWRDACGFPICLSVTQCAAQGTQGTQDVCRGRAWTLNHRSIAGLPLAGLEPACLSIFDGTCDGI
eukprot:1160748-Pelagomonas_calceolata.AAC.3